ncbi:RNase H family protein [Microterricola viridarii]|uniref:Ribonuclease H n=1 Tax=Microterricola viridarii TaxID=412690 RepID=A0A1H1ZNW4_9MICO|nr:RNase H family protein [Microterricola viridarii]SDT34916.1 ribonuclease HI [Microterricola viridarii]
MTIIASADGSALGNPGPAGWAWYVDDDCWAAGGWPHATNNQGELTAVLELFRATAHLDEDLHVLCDSQYVINSVTKWMPGWKKKGWRKADGKPVMNVEILKEIDEALAGRRYRFEWVKGHANHPMNEAADARARAASEAFQNRSPVPTGPGWTRDGAPARAAAPTTSAPAASAQASPAPEASAPVATQPDLFSFDELGDIDDGLSPEGTEWRELTLTLSVDEHARLLGRARDHGVSPEEFLRSLI